MQIQFVFTSVRQVLRAFNEWLDNVLSDNVLSDSLNLQRQIFPCPHLLYIQKIFFFRLNKVIVSIKVETRRSLVKARSTQKWDILNISHVIDFHE